MLIYLSPLVKPVKLQLVRAFCLPLLVYCLGALEVTPGMVKELVGMMLFARFLVTIGGSQ